jgi:hypothetical protein
MARYVEYKGGLEWDFSRLFTMPIDPAFPRLIESFLASVLGSDSPRRGWKIPETTLVFPWIARMFPDAYFIYWVRDPRDCILGGHVTDDLSVFGVPYTPTDDLRHRRAISWYYQHCLMQATPSPARRLDVRFEDFVLKQDVELERLEGFLGFPLAKIPVRTDSIGRWKTAEPPYDFDFFPRSSLFEGNSSCCASR